MRPVVSFFIIVSLFFSLSAVAENRELIVYSARKEHLIKPLFDFYTQKSGVTIRYTTDKAGLLLTRLKAEGSKSPADLLMTVDAGNLWHAAHLGLLQPVASPILQQRIPEHLRDPDNRWFGLSLRARTIVYHTDRVDPHSLSSYAGLADDKWRGRLCLRTAKKVYNQSLVAMLLHRWGQPKTEQIVSGWVKNLATAPFSDDTAVLKAIAAGQCDLGVVNTYYYGRLLRENPQLPVALFWPDKSEGGVHVNVSGAGITRSAKHPDAARALLEWLTSEEAQKLYAGLNLEYPVNPDVAPVAEVAAWGTFSADPTNLSIAGELQKQAAMLMDRVGYR
ncbi:MAG TPA: Fe(3+) ABC transporter substrate-binding protein [Gammaproteobacteria bacterium]|nr:Fe(3+) ABC transporter substrate-binding protein [Gammaproteobacteria bacterium]